MREEELEIQLNKIDEAASNHDYPVVESLSRQLLSQISKESNERAFLKSTHQFFWACAKQGRSQDAIVTTEQAIESLSTSKDLGLGLLFRDVAMHHSLEGNTEVALGYYKRATSFYEEHENQDGLANVADSLGVLYIGLGDPELGLEYHQKALGIFEAEGIENRLDGVLCNVGSAYLVMQDFDNALTYFLRALGFAERFANKPFESNILQSIGAAYAGQENYELALEYFEKSLKLNLEIRNKLAVGTSKGNIGRLYALKGFEHRNLAQAESYLKDAVRTLEEVGYIGGLIEVSDHLTTLFKEQERWLEALRNIEQERELERELRSMEALKKANAYDEERKQLEREKELAVERAVAAQRLDMLHNTLPAEIADRIVSGESQIADQFDQVTVLFTDFKGFTSLSEQVTPKELVNDLHTCFSAFDNICEKHGIEKIKTIGDAYMAAGGLPSPNSTHPQDVVKAALEMASVVEQGKAKKIDAGLPFFEIRIGVHTGPVVAGIVGVKKFQYDIWGDTVNTASRMESSGEVSKVNISEATYDLLKDDPKFSFESRGKIEAKGKGEMEMYFVSQKG